MGQMLEKPITAKESDRGCLSKGQHGMTWSASGMQGWRSGMEDAHICLPELPGPWSSVAMFGVLDGHGGEQVAKFSSRHLPEELHERLCMAKPWKVGQAAAEVSEADLRKALTDSFHEMDELLRSGNHAAELKALTNPPCRELTRPTPPRNGPVDCNMVGCTCNICCITPEFYLCANAGDSRAVLCRGGRAVPLSEDHKPNDPREERRIRAAGGTVETQHAVSGTQYRVNGNLNLSRALGDLEYKKNRSLRPEDQIICATPDFICEQRHAEDEFIVICCDGVWDVKSNQEVVDFVRKRLPEAHSASPAYEAPEWICEELLDDCLSPDLRSTKGLGGDNMTAVIIRFPPAGWGKTAEISSSGSACRPERVTAAQPEARLLDARVQAASSGTGMLVVRFAFSGSAPEALRDVCLGFCERTGELELGLAGNPEPQKFSLQAHVPKGAKLHFPQEEACIAKPSVVFFPKSKTVRVILPWREGSRI